LVILIAKQLRTVFGLIYYTILFSLEFIYMHPADLIGLNREIMILSNLEIGSHLYYKHAFDSVAHFNMISLRTYTTFSSMKYGSVFLIRMRATASIWSLQKAPIYFGTVLYNQQCLTRFRFYHREDFMSAGSNKHQSI